MPNNLCGVEETRDKQTVHLKEALLVSLLLLQTEVDCNRSFSGNACFIFVLVSSEPVWIKLDACNNALAVLRNRLSFSSCLIYIGSVNRCKDEAAFGQLIPVI